MSEVKVSSVRAYAVLADPPESSITGAAAYYYQHLLGS